jgi:ACT domain-containing protein
LNNCVYFFILLETGKNIHRGALLEAAVRETGANITKMVKRMGIARGTFYNHKNDPNLSLEQLAEYGKVLKYDFSQDLPEMKRYVLEEPEVPYTSPKTIEEAIEQRDYWRERYYKKQQDYLKLLANQRNV